MAEPKPEEIPVSPESEFFRNIADDLSTEKLSAIGEEVVDGFEIDYDSLSELRNTMDQYNPLFNLKHEPKNQPWGKGSSIKIPAITIATTNFWARSSINLFPQDNNVVRTLPVDNSTENIRKADRVKRHMNWQLMTMPGFFTGFDKTLMMLAKDGFAFRKTYWDSNENRVMSTPVLPQDFVANYYTVDLKTSQRFSQILRLTPNEIKIKQKQGIYIDDIEDIPDPSSDESELDQISINNKRASGQDQPSEIDYTTPREVLETHTYLNIGDDEIRRPYIVTVDKETRQVYRIIDRNNPETGKPIHYFTAYSFWPNPDSIFGFGFGSLLLGVTSSMNTSINQMTDAATLSNHKGGWVLKGSQMSRGSLEFKMGQFKQISVRGDDIRKAVFPLDIPPPSSVLLNLVEYLQGLTDRLTTVSETFSGVQAKSDTTATAAQLAVEQGSKVFTSIQLGLHRSFKEELKKIYDLNGIFLDETEYIDVVSPEASSLMKQLEQAEASGEIQPEERQQQLTLAKSIAREDYQSPLDVIPVSDPNIASESQKINKAAFMAQVISQNPFLAQDPAALQLVTERQLEAAQINTEDITRINEIMSKQVEQQQAQAEAQQQAEQQGVQQEQDEAARQQNEQELDGKETRLKDDEKQIREEIRNLEQPQQR